MSRRVPPFRHFAKCAPAKLSKCHKKRPHSGLFYGQKQMTSGRSPQHKKTRRGEEKFRKTGEQKEKATAWLFLEAKSSPQGAQGRSYAPTPRDYAAGQGRHRKKARRRRTRVRQAAFEEQRRMTRFSPLAGDNVNVLAHCQTSRLLGKTNVVVGAALVDRVAVLVGELGLHTVPEGDELIGLGDDVL